MLRPGDEGKMDNRGRENLEPAGSRGDGGADLKEKFKLRIDGAVCEKKDGLEPCPRRGILVSSGISASSRMS